MRTRDTGEVIMGNVKLDEVGHTSEVWRILDRVLPDWRDRKLALESKWRPYLTFGMGDSGGGAAADPPGPPR